MSFESLANELILDALEYLSFVDLFHCFNGLNHRFNNLIVEFIRTHPYVDLRLGYQEDIHLMRRRYFPSMMHLIEGIYLSDKDTNPHQIDFFLSRLFPFYRFENLKSISLENIYSIDKILRILDDFQRLTYLTDLHLHRCFVRADQKSILILMNQIWSLSNLIHCTLDISYEGYNHFFPPEIISCSIKDLTIKGVRCLVGNLFVLCENTPSLEYLSVDLWNPCDYDQKFLRIPSLTTLKIEYTDQSMPIAAILRQMPNLKNLSVQTKNVLIDGLMWQNLITRNLLQLKTFQCWMEFNLTDSTNIEMEINRIMNNFRTSFWTEEHQWFIQCHWNEEASTKTLFLYTLPFSFYDFTLHIEEEFRMLSTYPHNGLNSHSKHVKSLTYSSTSLEDFHFLPMSFDHLRHLSITVPLDGHFQEIVPQFDHLISLEIRLTHWIENDEDDQSLIQIQNILDRAPRLFSIKYHSWTSNLTKSDRSRRKITHENNWGTPPFSNRSSSVRHLDLRGLTLTNDYHCYGDSQCSTLINSPLGKQCQFLQIEVAKRNHIVDLVKKMSHLRALNVRCREQKKNDQDLIKWVHDRLGTIFSFAKDGSSPDDIRLWRR